MKLGLVIGAKKTRTVYAMDALLGYPTKFKTHALVLLSHDTRVFWILRVFVDNL